MGIPRQTQLAEGFQGSFGPCLTYVPRSSSPPQNGQDLKVQQIGGVQIISFEEPVTSALTVVTRDRDRSYHHRRIDHYQ